MKRHFHYFVVIYFFQLFGCSSSERIDYQNDAYLIKGTIHLQDVESECWQLTTQNGYDYELLNTEFDKLHHDGNRAELIVSDLPGYLGTCLIGKPVKVLKIILLSQY